MRRACLALVLFLFAGAIAAQQPQMFYVHEEIAKPSKIAEYEKTSKEFGAMMRDAGIPFYYDASSTDDFHYYFVLPMKGGGDLDKMMQTFMVDLPKKAGAQKMMDVMRRGGATMEKSREWIVFRRDDISYMPAKPRLKPEEMQFFYYDYYYIKPGMEDMVDAVSNEWKAALTAANIGDGFTVYQAFVGGDMPLVVVVTGGKSAADLAAHEAKTFEALGEKGAALNAKTLAIVRKFERKVAQARPDLSNPAPKAAETK